VAPADAVRADFGPDDALMPVRDRVVVMD
jgi:hypothetical protein